MRNTQNTKSFVNFSAALGETRQQTKILAICCRVLNNMVSDLRQFQNEQKHVLVYFVSLYEARQHVFIRFIIVVNWTSYTFNKI